MKLSTMQGVRILATGSAVPSSSVSNQQISNIVDTSNDWIVSRTGIQKRHIFLGSNKSIVDLAVLAAFRALQQSFIDPLDVDVVILATSSPNDLFGSASQVQYKIGALNAFAFDVTAACSGFVISLVTAIQFLQNSTYRNILVIGADVLSKWVNWSDRSTCILFGDGAGAVILQSCLHKDNQILGFQLNTDGQHYNTLSLSYNEKLSSQLKINIYQGLFDYIVMNGKEVYKFAISKVPLSIMACLESANLSIDDIDWLLLHQANQRILHAVANKLAINYNKIISNLEKYGNTSAASIPLALDETVRLEKIKNNDIIVISGFGAGLTWGTIIIKWHN